MKIPFFCSYIPVELLTALGHEVVDISFLQNEKYGLEYSCSLHDNICSYAKYLFQKIIDVENKFDFVVVPKVCDAMKHLHSSLQFSGKIESCLLDIPGRTHDQSIKYLQSQYLDLVKKIAPDHDRFNLLHIENDVQTLFARSINWNDDDHYSEKIGVAGSSYSPDIFRKIFKKYNVGSVFFRHCAHGKVSMDDEKLPPATSLEGELFMLAQKSLQNTICPRCDSDFMTHYIIREINKKKISGLIISALKFCDFYAFELEKIKKKLPADFPCLYIENDLSVNSNEQNVTRIEAFLEKILSGKTATKTNYQKALFPQDVQDVYSVGLDIGSTTTKGILLKNAKDILASVIMPTSINMKDSADIIFNKILEQSFIPEEKISRTIFTGYGRTAFPDQKQTTEITCHAVGVNFLKPQAGTIIDIGGQDSKVIRIDENGNVLKFVMNDKCAAGTGRFLESMVQRMNITFEQFSALSLEADNATQISSMCSVFAESEVVSLMTQGITMASIARGLNVAIAERVSSLVRKVQGQPPFILTGGLSLNTGFVRELENALGEQVTIFRQAQMVGAIGAAVIGIQPEKSGKKSVS